jgi:hypothetical protein
VGRAFTSLTDLLDYLPRKSFIYMLKMTTIRARLPFWLQHYAVREAPTTGKPEITIRRLESLRFPTAAPLRVACAKHG